MIKKKCYAPLFSIKHSCVLLPLNNLKIDHFLMSLSHQTSVYAFNGLAHTHLLAHTNINQYRHTDWQLLKKMLLNRVAFVAARKMFITHNADVEIFLPHEDIPVHVLLTSTQQEERHKVTSVITSTKRAVTGGRWC